MNIKDRKKLINQEIFRNKTNKLPKRKYKAKVYENLNLNNFQSFINTLDPNNRTFIERIT